MYVAHALYAVFVSIGQDALSRGQTPDMSARRVDDLRQELRRLQQQIKDERGTIDTLRKERVDLETEVHELRQSKTSQHRKLRDLDRRIEDTEQEMTQRIERAERLVQESASRRARFEEMSDFRSPTPGRLSADFRRSPSPAGRPTSKMSGKVGGGYGGYKSASLGDLMDEEIYNGR